MKNVPPMVIFFDSDVNVSTMIPLLSRFTATVMLAPTPLSRSGNISDVYTHVIGRSPIEKKAVLDKMVVTHSPIAHVSFRWDECPMAVRPRRERIMPTALQRRRGSPAGLVEEEGGNQDEDKLQGAETDHG